MIARVPPVIGSRNKGKLRGTEATETKGGAGISVRFLISPWTHRSLERKGVP